MKIGIKTLAIIASLIILLLVPATACICPPEGPWPMPPWCDTEEIEAGKPTKATFWVTVPYNTPQEDSILLAIQGQEPVSMSNVGILSWETEIDVKGGDILSYEYLRGSENSVSSQYEAKITAENQKIYDAVTGWNDLTFSPDFPDDFIIAINMMDTWGRNYNFNWFEDTRENIASSFERVAATGAKEVYVHDFFWAVYGEDNRIGSTDYEIQGEIFDNDYRDEVMTQEDLNRLAEEAKANGLRIIWRSNMHFVDIGKYIGSPDIGAEVARDWEEFSKPKSEEWVEDFLDKWEANLLDRADMLNEAGFDGMMLTNWFMFPYYYPHEELANQRWKEIINNVKAKFNGEVVVFVDRYGFVQGGGDEDWSKYDFYEEADSVYYHLQGLLEPYAVQQDASFDEIKGKLSEYLDALEEEAKEHNIKLSVATLFPSNELSLTTLWDETRIFEPENPETTGTEVDWQYQADIYEAFFQAVENRENIERVVAFYYWWDDAMNPEDTEVRIDLSLSVRNKPAEAVIEKWAMALK